MGSPGRGLSLFEVEVLETVEVQRTSRYRIHSTSEEDAKREAVHSRLLPTPEFRSDPEEVDVLHRDVLDVRSVEEEEEAKC